MYVSFCHVYHENRLSQFQIRSIRNENVPSIAKLNFDNNNLTITDIYGLNYPRLIEDFDKISETCRYIGEVPLSTAVERFEYRLPRYGTTGLTKISSNEFIAATWNGFYILREETNRVVIDSFISNRFINDPHGIDYKNGMIYSISTSYDGLIITDKSSGLAHKVIQIKRDLKVLDIKEKYGDYDWRFIGKQRRGASGYWHFNNVRVDENSNKVYLTSRNANCIIEVDIETEKAQLRMINWDTPVMLHDGEISTDGNILFTSVDGKILICNSPDKIDSDLKHREEGGMHSLMKRDLVNQSIRIGKILDREINWCRGIADSREYYFTTIDGRYDQSKSYFEVIAINKRTRSISGSVQISYNLLPFSSEIRAMTGFSIIN